MLELFMLRWLLCVFSAWGTVALADDDFRVALVEHRARSGHVLVNGTANVAYGRGLLDPSQTLRLGQGPRGTQIRTVNVIARSNDPIYLARPARPGEPLHVFHVRRTGPRGFDSSSLGWGCVAIDAPRPPSEIFQRVEIGQIHLAPRATNRADVRTGYRKAGEVARRRNF
jgi:hypothetical protein